MRKVIEWCEQHKKDPPASTDDDSDSRKKSTDIDEWDQKFMQVDQEMLFEIILVSSKMPRVAVASLPEFGYSFEHSRRRPPTTSTSRPFLMLAARPSQT